MNDREPPALIGLDWGTTALRACLFGRDGTVRDRRAEPWGIQHLPAGGFEAAFRGVTAPWLDRWPALPILASGMVGSRQGWHEVPYVECPADPATLAAGIVPFESPCGRIHLVPGLAQVGEFPDVMRGEEVQIVGALAADPALATASLLVLPGTHCKWATVDKGLVTRFTTYLTGELFAMLRGHSIIGRPARDAGLEPGRPGTEAAFRRGVRMAREAGGEGIAGRLFTTRSLFLRGDLPLEHTLDHLSGLLVGDEIRSVVAGLGGMACPPLVLIGAAALCDRYRVALAEFGIERARVAAETGPAGQWRIAVAAGLVGS